MSIQHKVKRNEEVVLSLTKSPSNDCLVPYYRNSKNIRANTEIREYNPSPFLSSAQTVVDYFYKIVFLSRFIDTAKFIYR
jgi:hypothetical protein